MTTRVEVAKTDLGWAYCLFDTERGTRDAPPYSVGYLWRWSAARAGRRELRRLERLRRRRAEAADRARTADWESA